MLPKMRVSKLCRFVIGIKDILVIPVCVKSSCFRDLGPANAVSDRNKSRFPVSTIVFSCLLL